MLQKKEKGVDGKLGMYPRVILQFFLVIFNQMGLGNHRAEGENFLTSPKNRPSLHVHFHQNWLKNDKVIK